MCQHLLMYKKFEYSMHDTGLGAHGNNQARHCSSHVLSTESKGATAMQEPGNKAKAFGLSRQVVHKNTVESWKGSSLPMHAGEMLLQQSCMHVTLNARPWGVHSGKLGESLNTACCGMGSTGTATRRYQMDPRHFKLVVHTS